jgi:CheY-like chemotaxis protein
VNERPSIHPSAPPPSIDFDFHRAEAAHRLAGVRVLVVEDEPDTRELVACVLERLGADVTACGTAEEALAKLEALGPHIVVSDLSLPGVDGWEMIRRVRATSLGRTVPALALSANASLEDAGRALDAGFDVHLAKPIGREELVAAVLSVVDIRRC